MILISGYTDADKVPGGVAINEWGAGKISIGAIPLVCASYGNKTSGGSAAVNSRMPATTPAEAAALWGARSELSRMAYAALDVPGVTFYGIPVAEASGAAATLLFEFAGTWTSAGEVTFQLDEEIFRVSFASSDTTLSGVATIAAAKINGLQNGGLFCSAAQSTLTATTSAVTQTGTGPVVTLTGTALVSADLVIKIRLGGAVATATFDWSTDGGVTWVATAVVTASTVLLGSTGITANFAAGTYVIATTYCAQTLVAGAGYVTMTVANIGVRGNQHTGFVVDDSKRPSGMTVKIHGGVVIPGGTARLANNGVAFSGGSGTDDLTDALAAMASVQNDYEAFAQNDATNVGLVESAANAKSAFDVGLLQQYVVTTNGTLATAIALGQTQMNDQLGCCGWVQRGVEHPSRVTARTAALFSITDGDQPNTNYDDMILPGAAPQFVAADIPNRSTMNAALNAGVMPFKTVDGKLLIVRAINSHCLNGSTPDYRTYDHAETTVPIRVRKEALVQIAFTKAGNPYAGPDVGDGLPPPGTLTPRLWDSIMNANLQNWAGPEFNWLEQVDENPQVSEWNRPAKRIMSITPVVVKTQFHGAGLIVRQTAA